MKTHTKSFSLWGSLLTIAIVGMACSSLVQAQEDTGRTQTFVVTAYYSPCPDQKTYLRGYYEAEIRLNGRGTNGADGTAVYPGMLAAPKNYAFGTKIEIPGLGIGTVHDRGGAIKAYADYDRIDIWMGRCEEGLARALQWGKRTVVGKVYPAGSNMSDTLDYTVIPSPVSSLRPSNALFSRTLFLGSKGDDVRKLQDYLRRFGFFSEAPTGHFGPVTEQAVIEFQKAHKVIASANSHGAGVIGPKSQSTLKKLIAQAPSPSESDHTGLKSSAPEAQQEQKKAPPPAPQQPESDTPNVSSPTATSDLLTISVGIGKGDTRSEVNRLQRALSGLGYYSGEFSDTYDDQTIQAVFAFQSDHGIVDDVNSVGAGYFGPQTFSALAQALEQHRISQKAPVSQHAHELLDVEPPLVFGNTLQQWIGENGA